MPAISDLIQGCGGPAGIHWLQGRRPFWLGFQFRLMEFSLLLVSSRQCEARLWALHAFHGFLRAVLFTIYP